jgi:beta-N-acetylglucosaminidase
MTIEKIEDDEKNLINFDFQNQLEKAIDEIFENNKGKDFKDMTDIKTFFTEKLNEYEFLKDSMYEDLKKEVVEYFFNYLVSILVDGDLDD